MCTYVLLESQPGADSLAGSSNDEEIVVCNTATEFSLYRFKGGGHGDSLQSTYGYVTTNTFMLTSYYSTTGCNTLYHTSDRLPTL